MWYDPIPGWIVSTNSAGHCWSNSDKPANRNSPASTRLKIKLWWQNSVATLFWCHDNIFASCVRRVMLWVVFGQVHNVHVTKWPRQSKICCFISRQTQPLNIWRDLDFECNPNTEETDGENDAQAMDCEPKRPNTTLFLTVFQACWLEKWPWLCADKQGMSCALCVKHHTKNAMTFGQCTNYSQVPL